VWHKDLNIFTILESSWYLCCRHIRKDAIKRTERIPITIW